jgi:plastocyanin
VGGPPPTGSPFLALPSALGPRSVLGMLQRTLALVAPAAALVVVAAAAGQTHAPALRAYVDDPGKISLTRNGKPVTHLRAGTYTVVVTDTSADHNFAVRKAGGPTRQLTSVAFTGTRTVTVRLTRGRWEFFCVPHEWLMRGFVTVDA